MKCKSICFTHAVKDQTIGNDKLVFLQMHSHVIYVCSFCMSIYLLYYYKI